MAEAARRLAAGELVAFPTETVYGLGADAANPQAVAKIFALKGRPADHPLIVHIGVQRGARRTGRVEIPEAARKLAAALLARAAHADPAQGRRACIDAVTGGQDTVGLRCPSHPVAQALLAEFANVGSGAIAAPSANKFGHVSPTTAQHVRDEFGAGARSCSTAGRARSASNRPSSICRAATPVLLRPGRDLARARSQRCSARRRATRDDAAPRASGTLAAHYAPRTPLELAPEATLEERVREVVAQGKRVAVLARGPARASAAHVMAGGRGTIRRRYAHDLYAHLRALDASGAERIWSRRRPRMPHGRR